MAYGARGRAFLTIDRKYAAVAVALGNQGKPEGPKRSTDGKMSG